MTLAPPDASTLDGVAHTIQVALTPVFLLTGIGTLINVFSTRLAHVAHQVDEIAETVADASERERVAICHRLDCLRRRSFALDAAVILGTSGGAATCIAVMTLFYGALWNGVVASMLYGSFAVAILCTVGALSAFAFEVTVSSRVLRVQIIRHEHEAAG